MRAGGVDEIIESNACFFLNGRRAMFAECTQQVLCANQFNAMKDNEDYPGFMTTEKV